MVLRRLQPRPEAAISVNRAALISTAASFAGWPPNIVAVYTLHAGCVRQIELGVEGRPADPHATIHGLPTVADQDEGEYRDMFRKADALLAQLRFSEYREQGSLDVICSFCKR
jgi:hypothetical protein